MNKNIILGVIVAVAILVVGWSIYASRSNNVKPVAQQQQTTNPHGHELAGENATMIAMIIMSPSGSGLNLAECTSDTAAATRELIQQMCSVGMPPKAVLAHLERFGYQIMRADSGMVNPH